MWVSKRSEFYNRSMKSRLQNIYIEIYSTHNEGKYVVDKKSIRTLKNKVYKYITPVSKTVYINKLDDIVNKYNNTYHSTTKMRPGDVKSNIYIDFNKEINEEDPNFEVGDHVTISNYKIFFVKGYTPNWSEEVFMIKKVENTVQWTYVAGPLHALSH